VPSLLLSRAFEETYGIPLHDILGGSQHPNLFGYQTSVHHMLPRIAAAEALLHAGSMPAGTPGPELQQMIRELKQSGLENGWDSFRSPAGFGTHLLAGMIYITPKIGAPTMLAIKGPTVQTEQDYVRSLNSSMAAMRSILGDLKADPSKALGDLPNRDLDTGKEVQPGAYRLTDITYQRLLQQLTHGRQYPVPLELRRNVAMYYSHREAFENHISAAEWQKIDTNLALLKNTPIPACDYDAQSSGATPCPIPGSLESPMFFDSWMALLRVVIVGVSAYISLVLMLRVSGKRTLAKMNVFDLVVTVALGSTLAGVMTSKDLVLAEGILAFAILIVLQFLIAWLSTRSKRFNKLVKADPRLLFCQGRFLSNAMRAERVTEDEVLAAIRAGGFVHLDSVGAVVLETDGSFTVLPNHSGARRQNRSSLDRVQGWPEQDEARP